MDKNEGESPWNGDVEKAIAGANSIHAANAMGTGCLILLLFFGERKGRAISTGAMRQTCWLLEQDETLLLLFMLDCVRHFHVE